MDLAIRANSAIIIASSSGLGRAAAGKFQSYAEALDSKRNNIPLQKIGSPAELGDLVAFLSSPKSSYINGSSIVIDGGSSSSNL